MTPLSMLVWIRLLSTSTPTLPESARPETLPASARPAMMVVSLPPDWAYRLPPAFSVPSARFTVALRLNTFTLNAPPSAIFFAPATDMEAFSIHASLSAVTFRSPPPALRSAPSAM